MARYIFSENPVKKIINEKILHKTPYEIINEKISDLTYYSNKNTSTDIEEYYEFHMKVLRTLRKIEREIRQNEKMTATEKQRLLEQCSVSKNSMDILIVKHLEKEIMSLRARIQANRGDHDDYQKHFKSDLTEDFFKREDILNYLLDEMPPIEIGLKGKCSEMKEIMDDLRKLAHIEEIVDEESMMEEQKQIHDLELNEMLEERRQINKEQPLDKDDYYRL